MRLIKIGFPDASFFEKTRLAAATSKEKVIKSGASSIYFRNPAGFSANDFAIIEAFESEDAEIVKIKSVDHSTHVIELTDQTYQDHSVGVVIMKTPYDKVRVFKGTSSDMSTHTELTVSGGPPVSTPIPLRADNAYTVYSDPAGATTDYYSYQFVNSATSALGTQTLFTESDYNSVLTVDHLKDWFMFGLDLTDEDGYPFPNSMFEFAIRAAVDSLEKTLNVRLKPTQIIGERQDYYRQDYMDFAFIQLNEYPIFDVTRVALRYPTAGSDITFPVEWYQINKQHGQVHLIPTSGSLSQILIGQGGDYLTFVWKGWEWMPNLWVIDYWAGFPPTGYTYVSPQAGAYRGTLDAGLPNDLVAVVGKMACFYPLNIAGDLVGGIAIASKSIGIDGLSQSINTTSSAENAGYCLMKSSIYTDNGKVKIEDLVGKRPRLLSLFSTKHSFKSLVGGITNASKVWMTKKEAPVWKIVFDDGSDILATKEHPMMLPNGKYLPVEDLKESIKIMGIDSAQSVRRIIPNYTSGPVFDIEVPKTHNFVANQVVVHNSARLRQYERELKIEIPRLVSFYKGLRMVSC
jgi:hypothetical protein